MSKYAPLYMTKAYDGPEGTLVDLTLGTPTFVHASAEDTAIGTLTGMLDGVSTLSLVNDVSGKVKLVGNALVVGPTSASAATIHPVVRETNAWGVVTTHDTTLDVVVS